MAKKPGAKVGRVLFTREQIQKRLDALAAQIQKRYAGQELTVVAVLKGSLIFTADLVRRLDLPVRMDILEVASYFDGTRPAEQMELTTYMVENLRGRHVLVVDDIVDTGETLSRVLDLLRAHRPKSLAACVFLDKTPRRRRPVSVDFSAFRLDADEFVVGYGLDFAQRFRNLPHLAVLDRETPAKPRRPKRKAGRKSARPSAKKRPRRR
jgi:hypoxanthine phosphoribosyltransferase